MNIFILDDDIQLCAQAHSDIHVNKMATEAGQILTSALAWVLRSYSEVPSAKPGKTKKVFHKPFADGWGVSHPYHPATMWVAESRQNMYWTMELWGNLCDEWQHRFNKVHGSAHYIRHLSAHALDVFPDVEFTPHIVAFDKDKYSSCIRPTVVESYRAYYNHTKLHLKNRPATWTNRPIPSWIDMGRLKSCPTI
jgi:hypothetical protein